MEKYARLRSQTRGIASVTSFIPGKFGKAGEINKHWGNREKYEN
jgi:hypothetical protein